MWMETNNYICHYGIPRRSGRYPWGSGEKPYQSRNDEKISDEEKKQKTLKSGSASDILKFKGELTNQELSRAVERLRLEAQLSNYSKEEQQNFIKTTSKSIDSIEKAGKKIKNWTKEGIDTYNIIASLYNATPDGRINPLPIINVNKKKKN